MKKRTCLPVDLTSRRSKCSGLGSQQTAAPELNGPCTGWRCAVPSSDIPSHASHHASMRHHQNMASIYDDIYERKFSSVTLLMPYQTFNMQLHQRKNYCTCSHKKSKSTMTILYIDKQEKLVNN